MQQQWWYWHDVWAWPSCCSLIQQYEFILKIFLILCLSSLANHYYWLVKIKLEYPRHTFSWIPMKYPATIFPPGDIPCTTGIPPHIHQAKAIKEILYFCKIMCNDIKYDWWYDWGNKWKEIEEGSWDRKYYKGLSGGSILRCWGTTNGQYRAGQKFNTISEGSRSGHNCSPDIQLCIQFLCELFSNHIFSFTELIQSFWKL